MNYNLKQLSYFFSLLLILKNNGIAQEMDNVSGVVLHPVAPFEGVSISPELPSYTPFDNIKVSQDITNQRQIEGSIDINPRDPNNIVATWIDYRINDTAKVAYGYSFDGGQTWSDGLLPQHLDGYEFQGDPAAAADKDGNFFISFISFSLNPFRGGIYVAKSTDGGVSWPEPSIVRLDGVPYDESEDKPYIAIDRTDNETANNIYVAWNHNWQYENEIHFARSTDNGSSFQRQSINVIPRWYQLGAMPAVDPNGNVYVVWMGHESGIPYDPHRRNFYFAMSTDGGENFGTETMIIEDVGAFLNEGINLIKRIWPFPIVSTNPVLSGHIYITWSNKVVGLGGSEPDSSDVLFMRSTDYGSTWSSPINIINNGLNPSLTLNDQFFPWIAVNPEGDRISIMYYNRSDFPDNDYMHINISTSVDDGLTFTPPLRISDVPSYPAIEPPEDRFMGDYNGMVYSSTGLLYPIWADSRNGNWDIYTAPADIKTVSTSVISGWQTLSIPVEVTNYTKTNVWPTSTGNAYSYCGLGGYVIEEILANGPGYYVKFGSSETLSYAGGYLEQLEIPLCEGWNIIGSITETVSISTNVCLYPAENQFTSPFYIYNNGYQIVEHIISGRGHWVKVEMDGSLLVNDEPIHCEYNESIAEEDLDHFIVTDAEGKMQDLYVANLYLNPSLNEYDLSMPPPIPEVGFDARFGEGEYIRSVSPDSGVVELVISIAAQEYPVTVSWALNPENGIEYSIITEVMGKKSNGPSISHFGSTTLSPSSAGKFLLNAKATGKIVEGNLPSTYNLSQNYPNPFNPVTIIKYDIVGVQDVKLSVYDILGREITILVKEQQQPGNYAIKWDASNVASGIYFYNLTAGNFMATKKLILLK